MLQVNVEVDEKNQDDVGLRQAVLRGRLAEQVIAKPVGGTDGDGQYVEKDAHVDGVHAKIRQWREHRRRVVDFVELPEERNSMGKIVIEPVTKLVGEEHHYCDDEPGDEA